MTLDVTHPPELADFLDTALPFLLEQEAQECLLIGILWALRHDPSRGERLYTAVVGDKDSVAGLAMRTPRKLLLSRSTDPAATRLLAKDVCDRLPELDAVLGPEPEVSTFVEAWSQRTARRPSLVRQERIYRLEAVRPIEGVPGRIRQANARDRDLLAHWAGRFVRETGQNGVRGEGRGIVERHLDRGTLFAWEDNGEIVSMAAIAGETPNGARINLVYTVHEHRRRGYASACTAAVSQRVLDMSKRQCFLYTDLANPTTNHIYREVGYLPVRDATDYALPGASAHRAGRPGSS